MLSSGILTKESVSEGMALMSSTKLSSSLTQDLVSQPLFLACSDAGSLSILAAKNKWGFTPLLVACQNGHIEVVRWLITSGAEIEATENQGATPLLLACQNGHIEVVRLLITSGADVRTKDKTGHDSLFFASQQGHLHVVYYLCSLGADTGAQDETEMTALANVANESSNLDIVRCLVGFGADMAPPDTKSESRFLSNFIFILLSVSLVLSFSSGIFFLSCKLAAFVYE